MMPLFSIIIPVYNVAPYLGECLNSVLAQTFVDWEAICVDDGSNDGSGTILDEYAAKDARFKIIHQPNAGVSAARNKALDVACGEWLSFVDSDDFLNPKFLEMLSSISEDGDDMLLCRHRVKDGTFMNIGGSTCEVSTISARRISWDIYFHPIFAAAYRRKQYYDIRFKSLTIGEDRIWFLTALDRAAKIKSIDFWGYGYRVREDSTIHSPMSKVKFKDNLAHFVEVCKIIAKHPDEYENDIKRRIGQSMTEYAAMEFVSLPDTNKQEMFEFWCEVMEMARKQKWMPRWQRLVMSACTKLRQQFVVLALCYMPYWLKLHGVHR